MSQADRVWHWSWASDPGRLRPNNEDAVEVHAEAGLAILVTSSPIISRKNIHGSSSGT